jgi:hypothetical protein
MSKTRKKVEPLPPAKVEPLPVLLVLMAGPLVAVLQAFIERGNTIAGGINILLGMAVGFPLGLVGFYLRARRGAKPAQKHTGLILLLISVFLITQVLSYPLGLQMGSW